MRDALSGQGGMRLATRRPLCCAAVAWASGSAAGYTSGAPWWVWLMCALPFLALLLRKNTRRVSVALALTAMLAAGYTAVRSTPTAALNAQDCTLQGTVCEETQIADTYTAYTLSDVSADGQAYGARVRLYLYHNGTPTAVAQRGDRLTVLHARCYAPKGQTGLGGYDQRSILWQNGVSTLAQSAGENACATPGKPSAMAYFSAVRARLGQTLDGLFGERAGLARSLLLGDKSRLSEEEYESFQDAGIVHVLAVSGLHIGALAVALDFLLRNVLRLSHKAAYCITLPALLCYAAITGFPDSVSRAALLYACVQAAPLFGRPSDHATGLSVSYLLLAIWNPAGAFGAGFLLSFSAMAGITLLMPTFMQALPEQGKGFAARLLHVLTRMVLMSVAAALGILPVSARLFGGQTLWSLAANLAAIPLATVTLPCCALCCALNALWPWGAQAAARAAGALLWALQALADWVAAAPWALVARMPGMRWYMAAGYALAIAAASLQAPIGRWKGRKAARIKLAGVAALIVIALCARWLVVLPVRQEADLSVTFVDVGQGDGALVNAQGTLFAIDVGQGSALADRAAEACTRLEAVFLTHSDIDHAGGIAYVLEECGANTVYLPLGWNQMEMPEEIERALAGESIVYLQAGDVVRLSPDVTCEVLHPAAGSVYESDNDGSLVLLLRYGAAGALFLGDLPDSAIDFPLPDCDLVKLAHHGSAASSGAFLLKATSPSAAILSVGHNGYGHPSAEVLARLRALSIPYYRTDERGDITVRLSQSGETEVTCWQ